MYLLCSWILDLKRSLLGKMVIYFQSLNRIRGRQTYKGRIFKVSKILIYNFYFITNTYFTGLKKN